MNNYSKSKTGLFLMELIITVMLFAVCSAVCIRLFVSAHVIERETRELNHAVEWSQGFAEVMRGSDGRIDSIVDRYPTAVVGDDGYFQVYYDDDFAPCAFNKAAYVSDVVLDVSGAIENMEITVVRLSDYKELYSMSATKYMNNING